MLLDVSQPTLPADPASLAAALEGTGYLPDEGLATAAYLALVMHRPLFLEGEAGVGKTALAHALAEVTGRPIYRLQCYEGLEASQALYDWDFGRQLLHLRAAEAAGTPPSDPEALEASLYDRRFLLARPLLQALEDSPSRAARRRGRPGRRRVRGVPARGALRLHHLHPRARHDRARRRRRSSSSPPTAPARCTTRSSAAASTTGSSTPTSTARWRSCAAGCPRSPSSWPARWPGRPAQAAQPGPAQAARASPRRWTGRPRCTPSAPASSTPTSPPARSARCSSTARTPTGCTP